ncbi:MAG: ACT domain-containing protein [Acetobacteraceae bacterium]
MHPQVVKVRAGRFAICQLRADASIPPELLRLPWYSITKTDDELSLVIPEAAGMLGDRRESGWRCLEMAGPFALSIVGVLAAISATLANAGVSIVAVSTFNTDYLLVKDADLVGATAALRAGGYTVIDQAAP